MFLNYKENLGFYMFACVDIKKKKKLENSNWAFQKLYKYY